MESRNASFFEDVFPCKSKEKPGSSKRKLEIVNENRQDQNKDSEAKPKRIKIARMNILVQLF